MRRNLGAISEHAQVTWSSDFVGKCRTLIKDGKKDIVWKRKSYRIDPNLKQGADIPYKVEELPKSIKMLTPDSSIILQRMLQLDDSGLHIKLTVDFLKPYYPSSEYPDIKEYYKKLFSILNEQVVLKKSVAK